MQKRATSQILYQKKIFKTIEQLVNPDSPNGPLEYDAGCENYFLFYRESGAYRGQYIALYDFC